ncbi:MAG: homocysteine S-methyltransferase family protein [Desulfobacter sp.]|uniref:homocysteine S-methyltransferase family protein n=1 Tax=Desulfobacter sp. TaxID=2294 RepID=UPI001B723ABB|nr:homocysteine S-methyltransferase family protein [Desulfobacter sp.]MBP8830047.1 homocysteine S-methyltransferase family protein [Desulfobacter sp.]
MGEKDKSILEIINKRILILDGATGTEMQKRGLPPGVSPELWSMENPEVSADIYRAYARAGSDMLYTCTFGGTPWKLEEFGAADKTEQINCKIAQNAVKVADELLEREGIRPLIVGDIGPCGRFIMPFGDLDFEQAILGFKRQVRGLIDGGVDLFVIETQIDIQESRAALLAVKEICGGFTMVSMTFDETGHSLNGTTPEAMAVTLESLGADVVGVNCSTGPKEMLDIIRRIRKMVQIPVMAKPNAGMPVIKDNETVFPMAADDFRTFAKPFAEAGVNIMGGCCGTTPTHIAKLAQSMEGLVPLERKPVETAMLSSATQALITGSNSTIRIIGERINPTGKKILQGELKAGNMAYVRNLARDQAAAGADLLDINAGMPGIDEKQTLLDIISSVVPVVSLPLVIDSSDPDVVEAAVRYYPGRALINSISAEKEKLERLLPVAAKYGAMLIVLPLADNELPDKAERRKELVMEIAERAAAYGYKNKDLVVDGLVMTVSSNPQAAKETLATVKWASQQGFGTVLGLSNISFGLPERGWVNASFFAMAAGAGLSWAIANPSHELLMNTKVASDVLTGRDRDALSYIQRFAKDKNAEKKKETTAKKKTDLPVEDQIVEAVIEGRREDIERLCNQALEMGIAPSELLEKKMIPAIMTVGEYYDARKYFLPQLIASAETMQNGFAVLEPALQASGSNKKKGTLVFATVQGDIHDIGKNIVVLMLRNFGFDVIDLGKDVTAEKIIEAAQTHKADLIGLSALMTTTMVRMPEVIALAKENGLGCKVMVGGAVVNREWAESIGAEYCSDGVEAVNVAARICMDKG